MTKRAAAGSVDEAKIDRACAAVVEGKHGDDQPLVLRRGPFRVSGLETLGLVEYRGTAGWYLTLEGKRRADRYGSAAGGNPEVVGYLVLNACNPKLVLCTDGDFHASSMVGPGSWCAKVYKTEAGAKRSWPDNPIMPCSR